jgi:hypothetical protein
MNRVFVSLVVSACLLVPSVAAAGDSEGGAAAAESLFQEGRKAMEATRYSDSCPKFLASQKLAPAIGTLLYLADCYEKNNQLASAWARFHEAIALAQRQNRANREQTARERADKLEPKLIKLSILSRASGIDVKLDGNVIDAAALGTPIPVDSGKHSLEASAKGKKTYNTTVEVSEKNKSPSVEIPPLEDAPPEPNQANNGNKIEPPKERPKGWSTQKTLGLVVAAGGVVGLGVGGFFGLKTSSTWNEAKPKCPNLECDAQGVQLATDAKNYGTISTIATIAGGVLLVGGAVLFFTGGDSGSSAKSNRLPVRVGVGPGSVAVGGSF